MNSQSLQDILYSFFDWHPARIQTYAELVFGVINSKTVRIKDLALHVKSKGDLHAKIVKVERLLLNQEIDFTALGQIIEKLLELPQKIRIAIDRTNWKFGKENLNFFVASIIVGNISIPISWLMLDKKGNSSTEERKNLIEEILKIIPLERIEIILADREFVGEEWFRYLIDEKKIPFAVRVKKCEQIRHPNGGQMKLGKYFENMKPREYQTIETKIYKPGVEVKLTCLQLEKEQLFLVSNCLIGEEALVVYKQRWSIERCFKSLKTSGFNLEDTHITDLNKLKKLFGIVALALGICVVAGNIKNSIKPIKIKKHGRKSFSLFTYGLEWIKDYITNPTNEFLEALSVLLKTHIIRVFA